MSSIFLSLLGCKSLSSHPNWVSAYGAAAVVGVASLLLGLLKDRKLSTLPWLALRETHKEKLCFVPGLQNLGNNCFLNVILQSLASCEYFQPFLQKVIEDCESLAVSEWSESLQLTVALASLLEELSAFGEGKVVLSPREVMLAMAHHIQNFNLTCQQDAEEALLHLLSSLRSEVSDCYPLNRSSLADAFASNSRILYPNGNGNWSEQERWQQHFLGPFDGILSSILTCQSCSSQISLNFQLFHSLPLSPLLGNCASIRAGCTLEDCLKQFFVAEKVDNYKCSNCWHVAAIKYLSLRGAKETEIEKIRTCCQQDSCTCRNVFHFDDLPWSNNISCTIKRLHIARRPKILCIQLQRVLINHFGEPVKLQGHIRFPLILNLLSFMLEELQFQKPCPHAKCVEVQSDTRMLDCIYGKNIFPKILAGDEFVCSGQAEVRTLLEDSSIPPVRDSTSLQSNGKVSAACADPATYRLVSVVEHFGRAGGGHYSVYRSVRSDLQEEHCHGDLKPSLKRWFCISDSDVSVVSEEDVLAAEASLLLYERIVEG